MKYISQWKRRGNFFVTGSLMLLAMFTGAMLISGSAAAAGSTCTWTGSGDGTSWSDSSNWSGCGGAPQNGDNLAFDTTSLSGLANLDNDISGLQVGSITFTGTGIYFYEIAGAAFSLSGGISDTSSTGNLFFNSGITLTADQAFTTTGDLMIHSTTLTIGAYNLTLNGMDGGFDTHIYMPIVGSGKLIVNGDASSIYLLDGNSPNFSGQVDINAGTLIINAYETNQLGTGAVTIADGATLQESINADGTYSVSNPITIVGNGANNASYGAGALIVHGYSATGTVNFTGPITLAGNATVGLVGANAGITGAVSGCGYSLSKASGASGTLSGNLTGSCGSGGSGTSSSASDPAASSSSAAAPDTGYGHPSGHGLLSTLLECSSIVLIGTGLRLIYRQTAPKN